jgi:antitoxin FitA
MCCYHDAIKEAAVAQILVRNVDDRLVERFKLRARIAGTSLEAEVRFALERDWKREVAERVARVNALAARTPPQPTGLPLAEDLIREDRDR